MPQKQIPPHTQELEKALKSLALVLSEEKNDISRDAALPESFLEK
jgi:hypothetical protein